MHYSGLYSVVGTGLSGEMDIAISQTSRRQGLYIIGTTGTGKSTLLANLILTDIMQGLGACLIEPHGDLTKTVLSRIPENRLRDVILLDLMDSEYPFGLNIFECRNPADITEVAKAASFVFHVFEKMWGMGTATPRLAQVLRSVTQTLIENPGTTFAEIPLLFWDNRAREQLVANVNNQQARLFWERYNQRSRRDREEYVESTDNKVDAYLSNDKIRYIMSQGKTTIDFRKVMDEGKILLVLLSPQLAEISRLVGAVLIGKLLMAAFARVDTREGERRQFNLYCDEYQRFATEDFKTFIDEARKFRVAITLSHQTLSQLDEANKGAATGSANMIVFRVTGEDGKELAANFDTTPTQMIIGEEPVRAPVSDVISHLVKRGHTDARVSRFAQKYLQHLESFINKKYDIYPPQEGSIYYIYLTAGDILRGRELLNYCLYRSMDTKSARFFIHPLALYMLAVAKRDGTDAILERFVKTDWFPLPPHYFEGFKGTASVFGHPEFVRDEYVRKFLSGLRRKDNAVGAGLVTMIKELRYTMQVLADYPILVDTGQYKPKYQDRTYADMENEIARNITQQPNFQARAKLLSGEHDIRTRDLSGGLSARGLATRINEVKAQMRAPGVGYCRHYLEVEKEIRERQERWRNEGTGRRSAGGPPPSHV